MDSLDPVAFDIETTGFDADAVVTVAGFAHDLGYFLVLNTDGRSADEASLTATLDEFVSRPVHLDTRPDERGLLRGVYEFAEDRLDGDRHYLTAFNGETWNGGFDLPFLRSACLRTDVRWPFGDLAYADMREAIDRFDTDGQSDLVGVYEALIGEDHFDPFDDSAAAVDAFERGDWRPLLQHNLADIDRTLALARLAGRFVAKKDFNMKNLEPPRR